MVCNMLKLNFDPHYMVSLQVSILKDGVMVAILWFLLMAATQVGQQHVQVKVMFGSIANPCVEWQLWQSFCDFVVVMVVIQDGQQYDNWSTMTTKSNLQQKWNFEGCFVSLSFLMIWHHKDCDLCGLNPTIYNIILFTSCVGKILIFWAKSSPQTNNLNLYESPINITSWEVLFWYYPKNTMWISQNIIILDYLLSYDSGGAMLKNP